MGGLSRRGLLVGTAATSLAAILPASASPMVPVPASAPRPIKLTWIVGTPGEWDHEIVRAATREAAIRFRAEECEDGDGPDRPGCDCEPCSEKAGFEATHVPVWDGRPIASIGSGDWLEVAFEARCERCKQETHRDYGHSVGGKAVCESCMTPADWLILGKPVETTSSSEIVLA